MQKFGVEIEFKSRKTGQQLASLLSAVTPTIFEGYNHETRGHWKIVTDASVCGGYELVSPPLEANSTSYLDITRLVNKLRQSGATVDSECGLHVHVEVKGFGDSNTINNALAVAHRFYKEKDFFNALIPVGRRNNSYAKQVSSSDIQKWEAGKASVDLLSRSVERYKQLNLRSVSKYGTVEFRLFGGTLNGVKIANWVALLVRFVKNTLSYAHTRTESAETVSEPSSDNSPVSPPYSNGGQVMRGKTRRLWIALKSGSYRTVSYLATVLDTTESSVRVYISYLRNRFGCTIYRSGDSYGMSNHNGQLSRGPRRRSWSEVNVTYDFPSYEDNLPTDVKIWVEHRKASV